MNKKIFEPVTSAAIEPCTNLSATIPVPRPLLHSKELFGSAREIVIEHAGDEYRLRMTRQGKLILTK
jgi:hemin uptake protein HemP